MFEFNFVKAALRSNSLAAIWAAKEEVSAILADTHGRKARTELVDELRDLRIAERKLRDRQEARRQKDAAAKEGI